LLARLINKDGLASVSRIYFQSNEMLVCETYTLHACSIKTQTEELIASSLEAVMKAAVKYDEEWLFIMTADHGTVLHLFLSCLMC
jgi:hypothetical protein